MGDIDAAAPAIEQTVAFDARRSGGEARPVVLLLKARLLLYRGDEAGARALSARIRKREAKARETGEAALMLAPSEDVLCAAVELSTRGSSEAEWDALEARSAACSIGQERIEVLEMRALRALRRGRASEACARLDAALSAASKIPNVMAGRLKRRLDEARRLMRDGAAASAPGAALAAEA
jgi:hypothetical protein